MFGGGKEGEAVPAQAFTRAAAVRRKEREASERASQGRGRGGRIGSGKGRKEGGREEALTDLELSPSLRGASLEVVEGGGGGGGGISQAGKRRRRRRTFLSACVRPSANGDDDGDGDGDRAAVWRQIAGGREGGRDRGLFFLVRPASVLRPPRPRLATCSSPVGNTLYI